jgi:hypothetical protein
MDKILWIRFLNDLFYGRSYIAAPAELSIPFLLDEKSTVVPVCLARRAVGRQAKGFLLETLGRTQSERRRRLALAGGFRLLRSMCSSSIKLSSVRDYPTAQRSSPKKAKS